MRNACAAAGRKNSRRLPRLKKQMNTASAIRLIALSLVLILSPGSGAAEAKKPNIVFILADDLGIDGVGCYGSDRFKGKTPNIDALSQSGLRFTQCYSHHRRRAGLACDPVRRRSAGVAVAGHRDLTFPLVLSIVNVLYERVQSL